MDNQFDTYIKDIDYDFLINTKYIVAIEKIENSKVYTDRESYYKVYTIDNKSYNVALNIVDTFLINNRVINN